MVELESLTWWVRCVELVWMRVKRSRLRKNMKMLEPIRHRRYHHSQKWRNMKSTTLPIGLGVRLVFRAEAERKAIFQ